SFKQMNKYKQILVRYAEKRINRISHKVIHVSESEEQEAISNKLITKHKSSVILNGVIDPEQFPPKGFENLFTIVNLARVDDQKNPFEFVEIAKNILNNNTQVQFIWAGNGKHLDEVRKKIKT